MSVDEQIGTEATAPVVADLTITEPAPIDPNAGTDTHDAIMAPNPTTTEHDILHRGLAELGKLEHFTYEEIKELAAFVEKELRKL